MYCGRSVIQVFDRIQQIRLLRQLLFELVKVILQKIRGSLETQIHAYGIEVFHLHIPVSARLLRIGYKSGKLFLTFRLRRIPRLGQDYVHIEEELCVGKLRMRLYLVRLFAQGKTSIRLSGQDHSELAQHIETRSVITGTHRHIIKQLAVLLPL